MIKAAANVGALIAVLIVPAACTTVSSPVGPSSRSGPSSPPVIQAARIYVAAESQPPASRYVLYDNGTFALQYPGNEYRGTYTEANALITFEWEGWSTAGPWGATGSISADSLTVRYKLVMQLSDFEDGVYIRTAN